MFVTIRTKPDGDQHTERKRLRPFKWLRHPKLNTRVLYFDLIEAALGEAARKAFEMLPSDYQFQGPPYKKGKLEGELQGQAVAMAASSVLEFLDARGLNIPDAVRQRVQSSTDLDQLRRWIRRAAVVQRADELFDE